MFSKNSLSKDFIPRKNYEGLIEGGMTIENGNSETESFAGKVKLDYDFNDKWKDIFNSSGENKKENSERSKEEYRINNQTRYSVTKLNYGFLELEYIDDRFGGYDYQLSETVGFGRKIIKNNKVNLTIQLSSGTRQRKFTNDIKENGWVIRLGSDLLWKINNNISFIEDFDVSFDEDVRTIKSDSSLKIRINTSLYFKINLFIENRNDVPEGIKNTDSRTMALIGYDF